jgi:hypothetical protein
VWCFMDGDSGWLARSLLVAVCLAVVLVAQVAWAQTQCYGWQGRGAPQVSASAACSSMDAYPLTLTPDPDPGAATAGAPDGECKATRAGDGAVFHNYVSIQSVSMACTPAHCDTSSPTIGQSFSGNSTTMATQSYCHAVDGCEVTVTQSAGINGVDVFTGTETNHDCGTADPAKADSELHQGETCTASDAAGVSVCANPTGKGQCGEVNGEFVCLGDTPKDGCQGFASGAKVCGTSAGTPPVPNNGTPGTPATPTDHITQNVGGTQTTYNYYSSTVVAGGTAVGTPTQQPGQGTGSGSGSGAGTGTGTGIGKAGDGSCIAADQGSAGCSGAMPALEDLDSFQVMTQAFIHQVQGAPLLTVVADIGSQIPAGECPRPTLDLAFLHTSLAFNAMCDLWEQISVAITAVMLVIWGVMGVKIVLSA